MTFGGALVFDLGVAFPPPGLPFVAAPVAPVAAGCACAAAAPVAPGALAAAAPVLAAVAPLATTVMGGGGFFAA